MTRIYSQMHRTDKYSEHSSIIWSVWPNGWVFVYELSSSGFESSCSHLTFRFRACFEQGAQATIEYGFTLKYVRDMTRTYSHKVSFFTFCLLLFAFVYCKSACLSFCNYVFFKCLPVSVSVIFFVCLFGCCPASVILFAKCLSWYLKFSFCNIFIFIN